MSSPFTDPDAEPTDAQRTARVRELYDRIPYHRANDVRVEAVTADSATVRVPGNDDHVGNPDVPAVHGGVLSALIDLTGGAVCIGHVGDYTPTIDLRVDYLSHATPGELSCSATLVRLGSDVGVADMVVTDERGVECAHGRGTYKLSR